MSPVSKKIQKKAVTVQEPVVETVPEPVVEESPEPVVDESPEPEVETVESQIRRLMVSLEDQSKKIKETKTALKTILSSYQKELKETKSKKKRTKRDPTKEYVPHGFTKPVPVSEDLANFLGVPLDTLVARPSVTKAIAKYIKEKGLSNPEDGSIFKADKALKKVLGEPRFLVKTKKPELGMGYSFGSLQKYLVPHFQKQT
jgi:chromatin remodeling complex protein RSC6